MSHQRKPILETVLRQLAIDQSITKCSHVKHDLQRIRVDMRVWQDPGRLYAMHDQSLKASVGNLSDPMSDITSMKSDKNNMHV